MFVARGIWTLCFRCFRWRVRRAFRGSETGLGKTSQRRLADINSAITALNWFAAYREPHATPRHGPMPSATQAEVTARVIELVDYVYSMDVAIPQPKSAFLDLT